MKIPRFLHEKPFCLGSTSELTVSLRGRAAKVPALRAPELFEAGFFKPALDFVEAEGVAFFCDNEHLHGEH
jgi:hypothetical protein